MESTVLNQKISRDRIEKIILWLALSATTVIILSAITFALGKNIPCLIVNLLTVVVMVSLVIYVLFHKKTITQPAKPAQSVRQTWFKILIGFIRCHKFVFIFWSIMIVAILVRTVLFVTVPAGLNADEASMLYDAYALGKFGIDRNGASFPVYLEAWGHGQNALLTYLTIPFVLIFGMNVLSARIVTLVFSLISIFVFYYLVKKLTGNRNAALVGMALFALCPYTIMISRWGLESNLFPHFLLYGITFLVKTYQDHAAYIFPACLLLGVSLYAYAISYLVIPLLLIGVYLFFFIKKKINPNNWGMFVAANLILLVFALPLVLFLMVNQGWLSEIHWGVITITKMRAYRAGEISLANIGINLLLIPGIVLGQSDGVIHNTPLNMGILYFITIPFIIIGVVSTIKKLRQKREFKDFVLILWLAVSVLTALLIKNPNINKINSIWFVLIIFAGLGIWLLAQNSKTISVGLMLCYLMLFTTFCGMYFTIYNAENSLNFNDGLLQSITYAKQVVDNNETIYFSENLHEPYIYCLIVDGKSPNEFLQTRKFSDPATVKSYGRYQFEQEISAIEKNKVYIMTWHEFQQFQPTLPVGSYHVFNHFVVVFDV